MGGWEGGALKPNWKPPLPPSWGPWGGGLWSSLILYWGWRGGREVGGLLENVFKTIKLWTFGCGDLSWVLGTTTTRSQPLVRKDRSLDWPSGGSVVGGFNPI